MEPEVAHPQPDPSPDRFPPLPGPQAAAVLASTDPAALSDADLVAYLQAWEREVAHATAAAWEAAAQVADRVRARVRSGHPAQTWKLEAAPEDLAERAAAHEIATALHVSQSAAHTRIDRGDALRARLAPAGDLLRTGAITTSHITVLAEHTESRDPDLVTDMLDRVLPRLGAKTPGLLGKALARAEYALDPAGTAATRRAAAATRTTVRYARGRDPRDGMGSLTLDTVDHEAAYAYRILDTLARARLRTPGTATDEGAVDRCGAAATPPTTTTADPEGVDNSGVPATPLEPGSQQRRRERESLPRLRAQVLMDLITGAANAPDFPTQHGKRRIETQVLIDLPTLLALRENPAEIDGHPVPAPIARELASTGTLRRLLTDPVEGHLLDFGRAFPVPQALTEFVIARDRTCRVPGCQLPATVTDLDHAIPRQDHGRSNPANVGALCRSHHTLKTAGLTDVQDSGSDGSATYITVLGRRLPIPPRTLLPRT